MGNPRELEAALQLSYRKRSETDIQSALNTRDDLRAHYLARSGINLSRLVIKVQQSVMDKFRKQIGDIQLAEFVPTMIRAFSGQKDEVEGLASLMGPIDTSKIKGLGLKGKQDFSLEMDTDDGRINLNCAGGSTASQQALEGKLAALVLSPEYDRFFLTEGPDGQLTDRATMVHAILDYVDRDESMFGAPGQGEQYGYDQTNEPYLAKNNYIDTVEELQLVRAPVPDRRQPARPRLVPLVQRGAGADAAGCRGAGGGQAVLERVTRPCTRPLPGRWR